MARSLVILAAWLAVVMPCAAAPLEVYGRLPSVEAISISPDGERLATITTNGEQRTIAVTQLADRKVLSAVGAGSVKVRAIQWVDRDHLLLTASTTTSILGLMAPRAEWDMVLAQDLTTGKIKPLLEDTQDALNVVLRAPEGRVVDGKPIALLAGMKFVTNTGQVALFQVDLQSGRSRIVDPGFQNTDDWVVDAAGKPLAQSDYDVRRDRWRLRMKTEHGWSTVLDLAASSAKPSLLGLGRDGRSALVSLTENDKAILREITPAATAGEPVVVEEDASPIFDRANGKLIGLYSLAGDSDRYTFFDPNHQKAWRAVVAAYPGERVVLISASDDHQKLIVMVDSPTLGPAYALVDLAARKAGWLGTKYAGLKTGDVGPVKSLRFKAKDGLELTGYLTLPAGREAKNLPLVVFPHGGPATRDTPGFNWWAQAMASRGYAVLQVNFRGSDGFGWDFLAKGFGEWGRKMQTDLSDGVRHIAAEGIIDPKRVCIVGASYGGYAALAGAAFDPGVYRCAASVAGPSDLRKMVIFSRDHGGILAQHYWTRFMGVESLGDPALQAISPSEHADKIDIPVLLIHGRDDTVVALAQSNLMADALKRAGKPVELIVMPGEDHWLTRGDTRLQMLKAVVGFLEKHNPPS